MKKIKIDFILFDLIGTTIKDSNSGTSLIIKAFHQAFLTNGHDISYELLNQQRGKRKREAIQNILSHEELDEKLTDKIYADFIDLLNQSVHYFSEMEGASEVFNFAKEKNIKVGVGSGLPLDFIHKLLPQVGWKAEDFDYINSSGSFPEGRPNPAMILDAMQKLNLTNLQKILKVGDTVVDVQEGKNANTLTAMVLTGTQGKAALGEIVPDYIFDSVKEVIEILRNIKCNPDSYLE